MLTSEYFLKFVAALVDVRHQHHHHQTAMMVENFKILYLHRHNCLQNSFKISRSKNTRELDKLHH